jgi:hypothetical protein
MGGRRRMYMGRKYYSFTARRSSMAYQVPRFEGAQFEVEDPAGVDGTGKHLPKQLFWMARSWTPPGNTPMFPPKMRERIGSSGASVRHPWIADPPARSERSGLPGPSIPPGANALENLGRLRLWRATLLDLEGRLPHHCVP